MLPLNEINDRQEPVAQLADLVIFNSVGVLGPEAHYPHLHWARNLSRGLGLFEEEKTPSRGPTLVNDQVDQGHEGTIRYAKDKGHLG